MPGTFQSDGEERAGTGEPSESLQAVRQQIPSPPPSLYSPTSMFPSRSPGRKAPGHFLEGQTGAVLARGRPDTAGRRRGVLHREPCSNQLALREGRRCVAIANYYKFQTNNTALIVESGREAQYQPFLNWGELDPAPPEC